jgi:hypothetical protein
MNRVSPTQIAICLIPLRDALLLSFINIMPPSIYSQQLLFTVGFKDITFQIPLNPPLQRENT